MNKLVFPRVLIALIVVSLATSSFAQFVAYNDHAPGGGTAANTTTYSADATDFPGRGAGFMTNSANGARLGVTLTVTSAGGTTYEGTQGNPSSGTPLYSNFNGFVDFTGTPNPSIALNGAGNTYTYTFTGLDPSKRYTFRGGAVRAGGYVDRWTLCEIQGAVSYLPAHTGTATGNTLTSNQVPAITASQAAFNFGSNDGANQGDMCAWENIDPGSDGTFSVVSSQWQGTVPGGGSGGSKGYAITGVRLEEFNIIPVGAAITSQPQNQNVGELQPATFSVTAVGNPAPTYQWYKNDNIINGATGSSYAIAAAPLSDNGAIFKCVVENVTNSVINTVTSDNATLTVNADTTAPTLIAAGGSDNSVSVTFSEPVLESTATNLANYSITNATTTIAILAATLQPSGSNVLLTTSAQAASTTYTVTVSGIRDRSSASNLMATASTTYSTATGYTSADVGNPGIPGTVTIVSGGLNITGSGMDIGGTVAGTSDQFTYAYQQRSGPFDIKVRVQGLTQPDTWARAGLMARQSLASNSVFAAAFATPGLGGCYYQSRATPGAAANLQGSAPVNFPSTWLRLQRVGNTFTGYASLDGIAWLSLGSTAVTMSDPIFFGFVVSSHTNTATALGQFREIGNVSGATTVSQLISPVEPPGPSSRKAPIAFTEIMYKPLDPALEFIELYNSNPFFEDISNYRISGDVDYTFPANTIMPGGSYLVVAKFPAAVQTAYGITGVLGPYSNSLPAAGTIRLRNPLGHIYLEVPYSNDPPWPAAADGLGHSLVLARPSYGEGFVQAWGPSDSIGGSPGQYDGYTGEPIRNLVINEFLANTTNIGGEFIEIYNHGNQTLDLSGVIIGDTSPTNHQYRIPDGVSIIGRGYKYYTEADLGFSLNADGETIYLINSNRTRVVDAIKFPDQGHDIPSGRYSDGASEIYPLRSPTPGGPNSPILIHDIVINEIMYNPISENNNDEYIELYNRGTNTIDLNGYRFEAGIDFTITNTTLLAPDSYLVIARSKTNLLAHYPNLNSNPTIVLGDYDGSLKNGGERLALSRPEQHIEINTNTPSGFETNTLHVYIDEVTWTGGSGKWGKWSGGGGSSLELIDPRANHRLPSNWDDSDETHKATWSNIEFTGTLDNGAVQGGAIDRLEASLMGEGECLIDNVEVLNASNAPLLTGNNTNFDAGMASWLAKGTMVRSTIQNTEGYTPSAQPEQPGSSLHIRASARGDTGANRLQVALSTAFTAGGTGTLRAKARWLRGWPELQLRIKGNYLEAVGRMNLPLNLGTPGAKNSRASTNAAPAIYQVTHTPVLPAANQPVLVTARVHDPDGISSLQLKFRLDGSQTSYTTSNMVDNGTGGDAIQNDGIFTATIPGQASGSMIAFVIQASDDATPPLTSIFPPGAYNTQSSPTLGRVPLPGAQSQPVGQIAQGSAFPGEPPTGREALIRFGEPVNSRTDGNTAPQTFGIYRFWLTANSVNTWINRPSLSNERIEGTFIYGNYRPIYNISGKYAGSPYHQGFGSPIANLCHYSLDLPSDDLLLGTENFNKLHAPGNGAWDDATMQREQAAYNLYRRMDCPWNYRRSINFIINGSRRNANALMEDSQTPGSDVVDSQFPDDPDGNLYKLQPWFEFDDVNGTGSTAQGFANQRWCSLDNITTTGGAKKTARYRQNYLARAVKGSANDYQDVFNLVDAMTVAPNPNNPASVQSFMAGVEALVDVDEWLRVSSIEHIIGDWDAFMNRNSQNMYGYKPTQGKWMLMKWDCNIIFGNGSDGPGLQLFQYQSGQDLNMGKFYNINTTGGAPGAWGTWAWRRLYWRDLKELVMTHMTGPQFFAMLDAKFSAYAANGFSFTSPQVIKDFGNNARTSVTNQLAVEDPGTFIPGTNNFITVSNNLLTLTGTAPVDTATIKVNGIPYPVTYTTLNTYTMVLAVPTGTTLLNFQGYDRFGNPIPAYNANITVNYTGPVVQPQDAIVINEIMYDPAVTNAEYIEILNNSSTAAFDLSNWRIDGVDYTFPPGTVMTNKQLLLIAKNRAAFNAAYGSGIPVFGQFEGNLDPEGEKITLIKPGQNQNDPDTIIDTVRYEAITPWPAAAAGGGAAIQLIDAGEDDTRVANWSDGSGWRYHTTTAQGATTATIPLSTNLFTFTMETPGGDFYIDDIQLVAGTVAGAGPNLFQNGDFETGLLTPWVATDNHSGSAISTAIKHSGNASLHIIATGAGSSGTPLKAVAQSNIVITTTNFYTISFWYLPSTNATNVNYRLTSNFRTGVNPPAAIALKPTFSSPGSNNTTAASIEAFPLLWINEIEPNNLNGRTDSAGERDPWIELYNSSTDTIPLDGYALSDDYNNLNKWPLPNGQTIGPKQFKIIVADNQPGQTTGNELHTNFRLSPTNGSVVLSHPLPTGLRILDHINYRNMEPNFSYGSYPDGQIPDRQVMYYVTPGATNIGSPVPVIINEWLASNTNNIIDPATGTYEDWFELYNFGQTTIDLSGYYLTDDLTKKKQWQIPPDTHILPGNFLLVWADNGRTNNPDGNLHADFQLSRGGEQIGLFTPAGLTVDAVTFGPQQNNQSQGRYPDGNFAGVLYFMTTPTPLATNKVPTNLATPQLPAITDRTVNERTALGFTVLATDADQPPQTLTYTLDSGAPAGATLNRNTGAFSWTPTEAQGGATYPMTIAVSDNGSPILTASRSFNVTVNKVNSAPDFLPLAPRTVAENVPLTFTASASDSDLPAQTITYSLSGTIPSGAAIDPNTGVFTWTPTEAQGPSTNTFQVRATDNGSPNQTTSQTLTIFVNEVNSAPSLVNPGTITIDELRGYTNFLVASDSDLPTNTLTFGLVAPFISGVQIVGASGRLTWTPSETNGPGSWDVTVRVFDNGSPSMATTQKFTFIVNEVNSAPILTNLNNSIRTNTELTSITLTNIASDSDYPSNVLSYEIVSAPAGATVNATNGVFNWTPSEADGPSSNSILVRVYDNATLSLAATQRFSIVVTEVNSAPVLAPISDKTASPGQLLTFTNVVNDSDLPAQILTFSLAGNPSVPTGASLDSGTGVFTWTPDNSQSPSTNNLSVLVSDNGSPSLTATQNFKVIVGSADAFRITKIELTSATQLKITWESVNGQTYHLEYRDDLNDPNPQTAWHTLQNSTVSAGGSTASKTVDLADPTPHSQRFYRVSKGP